jgi:hypothetical protein
MLLPIFLIVLVDILAFTLVIPLLAIYAENLGATPFVETVTLSNVAVVATVLLWLVTPRPTNTSVVMLRVSVPTNTQFTPSTD